MKGAKLQNKTFGTREDHVRLPLKNSGLFTRIKLEVVNHPVLSLKAMQQVSKKFGHQELVSQASAIRRHEARAYRGPGDWRKLEKVFMLEPASDCAASVQLSSNQFPLSGQEDGTATATSCGQWATVVRVCGQWELEAPCRRPDVCGMLWPRAYMTVAKRL